ncbi:hypothetical protein GCM10011365_19310 [Marinicella pacifica]|uniref:Glycosyltransferase 2-like domain-containing protein n=1 Tax=Marinicella pacifica TaxID=1171543 RepID=A0A917FRM6_9GAMM|nr:glycosyltransferase family 2 protein [Marinicella pacifica]GGF98125.1 hypothetical protein GCM10011365_19310 [Marinicella pacifica]
MSADLSIVIVNYNSWQVLAKLLDSLASQQINPVLIKSFKVIIVDNDSTVQKPDFSALIKSLNAAAIEVDWIQSPNNRGFAAGCNLGAKQVKDGLLLFCNPDIEIPADGLNHLIAVYQNHKVDLLAPNQVSLQGKPQNISGRFPNLWRYLPLMGGLFKGSHPTSETKPVFFCDWISGAVILMRLNDFKHLGGWDEAFFMFMEDVDLCFRASQKALKVGVTNQTTWLHHHGVSSKHRTADRVRSKSAALAAKHIYINKHFISWRKPLAHLFVFLKYSPELMLGWLLSWPFPKPVFLTRRYILKTYLKDLKNGFNYSA